MHPFDPKLNNLSCCAVCGKFAIDHPWSRRGLGMEFKLKELKDKHGAPVTIADQVTGKVIELDPESGKKYIFVIDLGDLSKNIATQQMQLWANEIRGLLGSGNFAVCAKLSGNDPIQVYELEPSDE